jgi:hypothetical protein
LGWWDESEEKKKRKKEKKKKRKKEKKKKISMYLFLSFLVGEAGTWGGLAETYCIDSKVAINHVASLNAVFEEVAVAHEVVAHVAQKFGVVGSVDGARNWKVRRKRGNIQGNYIQATVSGIEDTAVCNVCMKGQRNFFLLFLVPTLFLY